MYMYSMKVVFDARSFLSLVRIYSYLTNDPTRSQIRKNRLFMEDRKQEGLVLGQAIVFRANAACEQR